MTLGIIFAILSGVCYAFLGLFYKNLLVLGYSSDQILAIRFTLGWLSILPVFCITQKWPKLNYHSAKIFLYGILFNASSSWFFFKSIDRIGIGLACVIFFMYPFFVLTLMYILDGYRPTHRTKLATFLVLAGLPLVCYSHGCVLDFWGIIYGALCSITYALFFYYTGKASEVAGSWQTSFWICFSNSIFFSLIAWFVDPMTNLSGLLHLPLEHWISFFWISFVCTVLPLFFAMAAMRLIPVNLVALLSVFEPLAALVIGWWSLGEHLAPTQFAGVILILCGIMLIEKK